VKIYFLLVDTIEDKIVEVSRTFIKIRVKKTKSVLATYD